MDKSLIKLINYKEREVFIMYYFIINPKSKSGRGLAVWNTVKQELDNRKIEYKYFVTRNKTHATKFTKKICSENTGISYIESVPLVLQSLTSIVLG